MGFFFEHRDNIGHDEHRLADVRVSGPLNPYRGLGDVVHEAAHLVGMTVHSCDVSFRAFRRCCQKYSLIGFFKVRIEGHPSS